MFRYLDKLVQPSYTLFTQIRPLATPRASLATLLHIQLLTCAKHCHSKRLKSIQQTEDSCDITNVEIITSCLPYTVRQYYQKRIFCQQIAILNECFKGRGKQPVTWATIAEVTLNCLLLKEPLYHWKFSMLPEEHHQFNVGLSVYTWVKAERVAAAFLCQASPSFPSEE